MPSVITPNLAPDSTAACPHAGATERRAECSKRLQLRDCLERFQKKAEHGTIDTGRYRCRYVAWGRGPVLVLIPGMAGDKLTFVMLMARLQTHFRCISYELPDGEYDGANLMRYRHDGLVDDLFALLDHLRVGVSTLFGFSFGTTIALAALHRQSLRFSHAILQGGFAHRPLARAESFLASWCRFLPGRLGHVPLMQRIMEENHRTPFLEREPEVWDYFAAHLGKVPLRAAAGRALMIHQLDLRPILAAIQQPVLLVCGDHDPLVNKTCERELRQGLRQAARAEMEHCGHLPHLSHPEVLAELVELYLLGPQTCERGA
jgi:pimeloyl-ACP methyl ester carboxylesterase